MHVRTPKAKGSPNSREAQFSRYETGCGRRKTSLLALVVSLFAGVAVSAQAHQQDIRYIYDGKSLRVTGDDPSYAKYTHWQVWLYEDGVRIPRFAAGLQYSRWGLIEGRSAESVIQQLEGAQKFEEAYVNFFGSSTRGRYTFFNPLGPIAVADPTIENEETAIQARYQLDALRDRLNKLIANARPSLENNESEGSASPHKEYFDRIRHSAEQVSRLYSQLARTHGEVHFIKEEMLRTQTAVREAENELREMTATLPSVKLPTSTTWMSHQEQAGSDGTIQVEITERGPGVSIRQSWSGGDGSMTGTVIVTVVEFGNIGKIDFRPPIVRGDDTWTIRVQPARTPFPQTVTSPLRKTSKRVLPAVNLTTTRSFVYFAFHNPAEAQDAYAYFLYHKQLGR